jgi:predicted transposase/invertase (TIGR01784 family)
LTKDNVRTEAQAFWATYFKTGVAPDEAPEYIKRAAEIIRVVNLDQKERDMLSRQERGEELWASIELMKIREARQKGLDEGRTEGRTEGEATGEARKAEKVARNMKTENIQIEVIAKVTGLPIEEIEKL